MQESLNAKHALCKGKVFLKRTHVVSVNRGLLRIPPDTPAGHILAFSMEIVSSSCQLSLGSIYDTVMTLKGWHYM